MSLRTQIIKLAHSRPDLRAHLLPLLAGEKVRKRPCMSVAHLLEMLDNVVEAHGEEVPRVGNLRYYIRFLSTANHNTSPLIWDKMLQEAHASKLASPELAEVADAFVEMIEARKGNMGTRLATSRGVNIALKDLPLSLQKALKSVGYRRRDIEVQAGTSFKPSEGSAAFEGSRGFVVVIDLATGRHSVTHGSWGGRNPFESKQVDADNRPQEIPLNGAVIIGESGGRGSFARIRVRPDNLAQMLPATEEVSESEKKALAIFKGLKAGYRADEFARKGLGDYSLKNPLIKGLVDRKLLKANSAGSLQITTAGKNAVGNYRLL